MPKEQIVKGKFTREGAIRKGHPELMGQVLDIVLYGHPIVAKEVRYKGKRICGVASFKSEFGDTPTIELL